MTIERPIFPPKREVEIIEPFSLQDVFCASLVRIDRIGPCRRLLFAVPEQAGTDTPVQAVVLRLVLPAAALAEIAAQLLEVPVDVAAAAVRAGATAH